MYRKHFMFFFHVFFSTTNFIIFYEKVKNGVKDSCQTIFFFTEILCKMVGMNCMSSIKYLLDTIKLWKLVGSTVLQETTFRGIMMQRHQLRLKPFLIINPF